MEYRYDPENNFIYTVNEKGHYHSLNDEPAIIHFNHDTKVWMSDNKLHRDYKNGPALISKQTHGCEQQKGRTKQIITSKTCYFKNGVLHHPHDYAYKYGKTEKLYYNGVQYEEYIFNKNEELHGILKANKNSKLVNEIWIDGKQIEYDTMPVIIQRNDTETLVFGYDIMSIVINMNSIECNGLKIYRNDDKYISLLQNDNSIILDNEYVIHDCKLTDLFEQIKNKSAINFTYNEPDDEYYMVHNEDID